MPAGGLGRVMSRTLACFVICLKAYRTRLGLVNLDSAKQSQIEAKRSDRRSPAPSGQGEEEDPFGKVAASPNSPNLTECGISKFLKWKPQEAQNYNDCCRSNVAVRGRLLSSREMGKLWRSNRLIATNWYPLSQAKRNARVRVLRENKNTASGKLHQTRFCRGRPLFNLFLADVEGSEALLAV